MKESNVEGIANHDDPESCVDIREDGGEALTGARAGRVLSREIQRFRAPTPLSQAEGHTNDIANARCRSALRGRRTLTRAESPCARTGRVPGSLAADGAAGRIGERARSPPPSIRITSVQASVSFERSGCADRRRMPPAFVGPAPPACRFRGQLRLGRLPNFDHRRAAGRTATESGNATRLSSQGVKARGSLSASHAAAAHRPGRCRHVQAPGHGDGRASPRRGCGCDLPRLADERGARAPRARSCCAEGRTAPTWPR